LFDSATIDGIELGDYFDDDKLTDDWLRKHKAYPCGFDKRLVHKVVMRFPPRFVDGLNGDRNRYLVFQAYHINTKYELTIRNRYYPVMFPVIAFKSMWDGQLPFSMNSFTGRLMELHFIKKNQRRYEAKFIAQVQHTEEHTFKRLEVFYKEKKYEGDKL
jgi:hypothetical protein